jgi:large subunit ribosomal protein L5
MADKKAAGGKAGAKGGGKGAGKGGAAKPANKGAGAAKAAGSGSKAQKGKAGQPRQAQDFTKREHAGSELTALAPRLKTHYDNVVRANLAKQFGFTNTHQIPTLEKIVLNCGVGEAVKQPKLLDVVVEELALITGQKPVRRKAKMWEFFDRFVTVAAPRIRDFRGLGTKSFDGRGNYTMGIKEQMIFPEINYDMVEQIHGMDLTFVTTAVKDEHAFALLHQLGMPFRGDDKPVIPMVAQPGEVAAA